MRTDESAVNFLTHLERLWGSGWVARFLSIVSIKVPHLCPTLASCSLPGLVGNCPWQAGTQDRQEEHGVQIEGGGPGRRG